MDTEQVKPADAVGSIEGLGGSWGANLWVWALSFERVK